MGSHNVKSIGTFKAHNFFSSLKSSKASSIGTLMARKFDQLLSSTICSGMAKHVNNTIWKQPRSPLVFMLANLTSTLESCNLGFFPEVALQLNSMSCKLSYFNEFQLVQEQFS